MPGPAGQGCCSRPSDITPARDGPAHAYPDGAVDGAARANRTSQYNAPSGVTKPVCRLTDRLPDPPPSDLAFGAGTLSKSREAALRMTVKRNSTVHAWSFWTGLLLLPFGHYRLQYPCCS